MILRKGDIKKKKKRSFGKPSPYFVFSKFVSISDNKKVLISLILIALAVIYSIFIW